MESIYLLPLALALLALSNRSLDFKGAFSAFVLGLAVLYVQNLYWLSILLIFFVVGTAATRIKTEYKKKYGFYQKVRSTENVIGNGGVALLMALTGNLYGFLGSLSTATADTLSSEIGVLSSKKPRMITNFKRVKTGTDGAVSALGTAAELSGVLLIALFVFLFNLNNGFGAIDITKTLIITVVSGLFGCTIDSIVGATIERKEIFDNSKTNFVATASGGLFAVALSIVI
jgi:uncharacterized protein (TIGR00297 family)